jgi:hypothetical protein
MRFLPATVWERMLDALEIKERAAVLQQVR